MNVICFHEKFTKVRTKFSRRLFSSSIEVSQLFLGEQSYIPTNKIWEVWLALGDLATDFRSRGVKPYDHYLLVPRGQLFENSKSDFPFISDRVRPSLRIKRNNAS